MWLHVPSAFLPDAERSISPSDLLCQMLEQSATWRGNSLPAVSWRRVLRKDLSTTPLSGLTSEPSTLARGVEAWIASLADSHVRTSPSPAAVKELSPEIEAASGSSSRVSFARFDPASSSWKTSAQSLFEDSILFSETWPRSGTMRSGCVYERRTWAPATDANGGSAWPTPEQAECWATPDVPGGGRKLSDEDILNRGQTAKGKRQVGLENEARIWPTPQARDWKSGDASEETSEKNARPLNEIAERFHSSPQDQATPGGRQSSRSILTLRRRLNPAFAAWLMGLPFWWTHPEPIACGRLETASFRSRQRRLLESF